MAFLNTLYWLARYSKSSCTVAVHVSVYWCKALNFISSQWLRILTKRQMFFSVRYMEPVDKNWCDLETDFVLSQFDLDKVLDMDVKNGNAPYSQGIADVAVKDNDISKRLSFEAKLTSLSMRTLAISMDH